MNIAWITPLCSKEDNSGISIDRKFNKIKEFTRCSSCGQHEVVIRKSLVTIKEMVEKKLANIVVTEEDPEIGFISLNTGEQVKNHGFLMASNFEDLWNKITRFADPQGNLTIYECSYVGQSGRTHDISPIEGMGIYHHKGNVVISILKDFKGRFWFAIDKSY